VTAPVAEERPVFNWPAIEAGPVIVNPLRIKFPELPDSLFADDHWSLRRMDTTPGGVQNLRWVPGAVDQEFPIPDHLVTPLKRITWLMINEPTPESYLIAGSNSRRWPAASSVHRRFVCLRRFAHFLGQRDIFQLSEVDADLLDMYATSLLADAARTSMSSKKQDLGYVALIAHLAQDLPEADRMIMPTWSATEFGSAIRGGDNSKEIIHPDTFAPLIWWARNLLACTPDLVAALEWSKSGLLTSSKKESSTLGFDAVEKIVTSRGGVLPESHRGAGWVAAEYLISLNGGGINKKDFSNWRKLRKGGEYRVDPAVPQPIPVAIAGTIDGRPWTEQIDFRDLAKLQRVFQAASAILVCACTGMRGAECVSLKPGALRSVPRPDGALSYRIDGHIYKAVRDEDDQQDRNGKHWVWATIKPGADAVSALEALAAQKGSKTLVYYPDSLKHPAVTMGIMTRWINEFIDYANELRTTLNIHPSRQIAPDPAGSVTLDRFRRSIAWHIVNRPEGLLAAGVQFGHMRSITTDGYASTITSGIAATMDKEKTEALYTTLQEHAVAAKTGLKVSGPAAKRLAAAVNRFVANRFPGTYVDVSKQEERRLRSDPDLLVRENPGHGCLCLADPLKPETMACSRENDGEPNRNDCKAYCGNRVYTDATVVGDMKEADQLQEKIENASPILAARIEKRIKHLRDHIAEHEAKALPLLEIMTNQTNEQDPLEPGGPAASSNPPTQET
jgi:hypothetical protein